MNAYSMDYRQSVAAARQDGMTTAEVSEAFGCSRSWVRRLMQRQRESGSLAPRQRQQPDQRKITTDQSEQLQKFIDERPDATLRELITALDLNVHPGTLCRLLQALDLPLKKKSLRAREQDRPDVKEARDHWLEQFADVKLKDFVFLDEFGAATNMTRTRARAPRGQRAVCKIPHGHWKVLSTIAALTVGGISCAASFDGATDTEMFATFTSEALVPTLVPGQVVVLDNLTAHKAPRVEQLVQAAGCRLLRLPPYSPDLNPIELAISKVKTHLRSLARGTVDGLLEGIASALALVTASDARHYIEHCGYSAAT